MTPSGRAVIRHNITNVEYTIEAAQLDWNQAGGDERQMGEEVTYFGDIEHPVLGPLSWTVWEYPVGMFNDAETDLNGHELLQNFDFVPAYEFEEEPTEEPEEDWTTKGNIRHVHPKRLLAHWSADEQREYLVAWFKDQFWDPAEETPYDVREGGYQYVYGGPYDAREELDNEFSDLVAEKVIESAVDEIQSDGTLDWAPSPRLR